MININFKGDDTRSLICKFLDILGTVNPIKSNVLTEKEVLLLTEFLLLPEKYSYQRFSKYAKNHIIQNLKDKYDWNLDKINLNSKIYGFIDKGYVWRDIDGVLYLKEYLIKSVKEFLESKKILITFNASQEDRGDN